MMKKIIALSTLFICSFSAFSQSKIPVITGKEAYKYLGQTVWVHDTLISGQIYQDSIAVCKIGTDDPKHQLTMIFLSNLGRHLDQRFFKTFQHGKISINGIVVGTKDAPLIILIGSKNLRTDQHPE